MNQSKSDEAATPQPAPALQVSNRSLAATLLANLDDETRALVEPIAQALAQEHIAAASQQQELDTSAIEAALLDPLGIQRAVARTIAKLSVSSITPQEARAILYALQVAAQNHRNLHPPAPPRPVGRPRKESTLASQQTNRQAPRRPAPAHRHHPAPPTAAAGRVQRAGNARTQPRRQRRQKRTPRGVQ